MPLRDGEPPGLPDRVVGTFAGHPNYVTAVEVAPDASWLATAARNDVTVRIWAADGTPRAALAGRTTWHGRLEGFTPVLAVAPDGSRLATATWTTARIWGNDG